jgi:hypothetical protein
MLDFLNNHRFWVFGKFKKKRKKTHQFWIFEKPQTTIRFHKELLKYISRQIFDLKKRHSRLLNIHQNWVFGLS